MSTIKIPPPKDAGLWALQIISSQTSAQFGTPTSVLNQLLNPQLMPTRLAALCVSALIATRPNHTALVIWVVDQFLLVAMAFFIMIGPEVDANAIALGFFVDPLVAYP